MSASLWGRMLGELDEAIDELAEGQGRTVNTVMDAQKLVYEIKRELPHCEKCSAPLEIAAFPVGTSQNFACTGCGDPASTEPVPSWLAQVTPNARQLYRVDPDRNLRVLVPLRSRPPLCRDPSRSRARRAAPGSRSPSITRGSRRAGSAAPTCTSRTPCGASSTR